jgi:hypothetical protein
MRSASVQEQTQIIATAIGKPAANALTIIKVNAKSGFASGRTLSTNMSLILRDNNWPMKYARAVTTESSIHRRAMKPMCA